MKELNLRMLLGYYIPFECKFQLSEIYRELTINEISVIEALTEQIVREQIYDN